jgi:hypothetical protein
MYYKHVIAICLFVLAATNIALNKQAWQVSTHPNCGPSLAVNGDSYGGGVGYCAISAGNGIQWWGVDLGVTFDVLSVVLYNRADCCSE